MIPLYKDLFIEVLNLIIMLFYKNKLEEMATIAKLLDDASEKIKAYPLPWAKFLEYIHSVSIPHK